MLLAFQRRITLANPDIKLNPLKCALVIIDMQNDFVSESGHGDRHGKDYRKALPGIDAIQRLCRELPESLKRIFIQTIREPDGSDYHWRFHKVMPERIRSSYYRDPGDLNCLRGTWGADIIAPLKPGPEDHIFFKRRYSAFYQSDLEMCLRSWGIDTLIFTGVVAEICVETSVRSAFVRDFDVIAVADGVISWNENACRSFLQLVSNSLGITASASEVVEFFRS